MYTNSSFYVNLKQVKNGHVSIQNHDPRNEYRSIICFDAFHVHTTNNIFLIVYLNVTKVF